jgi:mannose-6-phosphate isomerase-like protein (cupin superfamily)
MVKVVNFKDLEFIPASHEDPKNPGVLKKVLFLKDDFQKGHVQMINWAYLPKGKSFQNHYHEDMEEAFILISGQAEMIVGEEKIEMLKGDALVVPKKTNHLMKNIGKTDLEYIVVGVSLGKNGKTIVVE